MVNVQNGQCNVDRMCFNPNLHGLFGGRERMVGAEYAHPHQKRLKTIAML